MKARAFADKVCATLRTRGYQAFLVGGCVRDILLGREPADYDVTTDAAPLQVEAIFPGSLTVGARFGVVIVPADAPVSPGDGRPQVEVATFRRDVGYSDGRHPDRVEYTKSPQDDVKRRDFTINAMLIDPATDEVLDFVGGREDLRAGIIRAIGDPQARFGEDKLRMVRAVRFAARFAYAIEAETMRAIGKLAPEISQISMERLRDELTKILTEGAARRGFELLDQSGLLIHLLPEIARMKGVAQPPQFHPEGDVWIHTLMMLAGLPPSASPTLAWGVLLHDVGKPPTFTPPSGPGGRIRFDRHVEVGVRMAEEICRRFRFSNEDSEQILALVAQHMRFKDVPKMKPATLKRFVRIDRFGEHLELHRLDSLASHGKLDNHELARRFIRETPPEQVRPPRLLTGDDLISLGLRPGPTFKAILYNVEEAQLEGTIQTHDQAIRLAKELSAKQDDLGNS
jgi:poly(A) polymerase